MVKKEEGFARCNIMSLHAFPRLAFTFFVSRASGIFACRIVVALFCRASHRS